MSNRVSTQDNTKQVSKVPKTRMCDKGTACRHYAAGKCTFAHTIKELETPLCRFGSTCRIPDCKFNHPTPRKEQSLMVPLRGSLNPPKSPQSDTPKPANYKTTMCTFGDKCPRGEHCNFAHTESELRKLPCHFGASCRKQNCTFDHPKPIVPEPKPAQKIPDLVVDFPTTIPVVYHDTSAVWGNVQSSSVVVSASSDPISWNQTPDPKGVQSSPWGDDATSKKHILCQYFVDGTKCPHKKCFFAHGVAEQILQSVEKVNELCEEGDKCLYGQNCRFAFHSAAALVEFNHRNTEKPIEPASVPDTIIENNVVMCALPRKDFEQLNGYWYISGNNMTKSPKKPRK
jgi:hypothetical protein